MPVKIYGLHEALLMNALIVCRDGGYLHSCTYIHVPRYSLSVVGHLSVPALSDDYFVHVGN
jgi:hypothetical protein